MSQQRVVGVGIIGAGGRGIHSLGGSMARTFPEGGLLVTALHDIVPDHMRAARGHLTRSYREQEVGCDPALYDSAEELINDPNVDLIVITSHTCDHRQAAVPALRSGKKVYCDKPLAVTVEDAIAIRRAEIETGNSLLMGFTRRYEDAWRKAFELVEEGALGEVKMLEIREMIDFWHFFQNWHRRRQWSGGGLMDKCSHHADVFNWFSGSHAVKAHGFGGIGVFHPDPDSPLCCSECDRECPWRSRAVPKDAHQIAIPAVSDSAYGAEAEERFRRDTCVFRPGADDVDHAAIRFLFENGVVASLQYAIFCPSPENRRSGDDETLEIIGSRGRLRLVRYEGRIELIGDHGRRREMLDFSDRPEFMAGHFGADLELAREMRRFADGAPPVHGLEATRMIVASQQSLALDGESIRMRDIPDAMP